MDINFCRRCGSPLTKLTENAFTCSKGHRVFYDAAPAAGALLLNDKNEVLLIVKAVEPGKGKLAMPGGYCDFRENLATAVTRELREELGLDPTDYSPLEYLVSAADDYAWQGDSTRVLGIAFLGHIKPDVTITPGDDAADFGFFEPRSLTSDQFAFPVSHAVYLEALIKKLSV
ncbi:MAG TPA: NUDIX domain-containing protein [Magnetospirillaceae bacterium]|nr:NUDIX domain-containing protein [Magnetospirillaceae bacterium]